MKLPKSKSALLNRRSAGAGKAATVLKTVPTRKNRRWVVFIDAGHGGKDPGAIGKAGTLEKKITLGAARDLAKKLQATGKIRPILARSDDRYLRLRERIRLARRQQADVFISLHADSAHSSKARGISVFTLSDTASDKEAAALARKENKADLIGGPDLGVEDPDAAGELLRMFQRESMNQSSQLAAAILAQIRDMPGGDRRGHRFAGFAVLKAPDMPSVLVEMGFLSNREDEKNLRNPAYISKLNQRLTTAIINYLTAYGPK
jgi:N-acetylmuramoyl-L-alanine amidase